MQDGESFSSFFFKKNWIQKRYENAFLYVCATTYYYNMYYEPL